MQMLIKAGLRINGKKIDESYLEKDAVAGCRYASRKWLKDLSLDVINDNVEAVISIDGKELTTLELEAQSQREKLILTKHATISQFYAWTTLTQGRGRTYGVSYGVNDMTKDPGKGKKKPAEEI